MNRFPKIALAALAMVTLATPAAFAAEAGSHAGGHRKMGFERWDTDKNGTVTLAEMKASLAKHPRRLAHADKMFAKIDTNKDGQIVKAEFDAWHAARKGKRKGAAAE